MRPSGLSARLPVVGAVGRHPAACLMGRGPIPLRMSFPAGGMPFPRGARHYPGFPRAIPVRGAGCPRVTRPFAASFPSRRRASPLDLHVLGAPPAFVLSQDRTLRPGGQSPPQIQMEKEMTVKAVLASKCFGRTRLVFASPASVRSIRLSRCSAPLGARREEVLYAPPPAGSTGGGGVHGMDTNRGAMGAKVGRGAWQGRRESTGNAIPCRKPTCGLTGADRAFLPCPSASRPACSHHI